jgi:hypothetical protein
MMAMNKTQWNDIVSMAIELLNKSNLNPKIKTDLELAKEIGFVKLIQSQKIWNKDSLDFVSKISKLKNIDKRLVEIDEETGRVKSVFALNTYLKPKIISFNDVEKDLVDKVLQSREEKTEILPKGYLYYNPEKRLAFYSMVFNLKQYEGYWAERYALLNNEKALFLHEFVFSSEIF